MPPRLFYPRKRGIHVYHGAPAARERPELATLAAECIATAAEIEMELGSALGLMLDADARPALAMFNALKSTAPQNAALRAVAAETISERAGELLGAVLKVIASASQDRHKLAHWIWAYSPQFPELLLMADPASVRETLILLRKTPDGVFDSKSPGKILAYDRAALEEALGNLNRARLLTQRFLEILNPRLSETRDKLSRRLSREPEIAEALARMREARKKPKATPQPPRRKRRGEKE